MVIIGNHLLVIITSAASKPVKVKPVEHDFVTTEDGRLLIDEEG